MPHTRKKSFYPKPSSLSNKLFFDVGSTLIIIQQESEKMIRKANFDLKKYNASDFDMKILQHVRFWIEKNTTR